MSDSRVSKRLPTPAVTLTMVTVDAARIGAHRATQVGRYLRNLLRPWKIFTFSMGASFFVWGAYYWDVPTWDVGVSLLMSALCYLLAPWAVLLALRAVRERPQAWPRDLLIAGAIIYFVASGSYEIYNTLRMGGHPVTYWENLRFSIPVTLVAGFLWQFDGTFADLSRAVQSALTR